MTCPTSVRFWLVEDEARASRLRHFGVTFWSRATVYEIQRCSSAICDNRHVQSTLNLLVPGRNLQNFLGHSSRRQNVIWHSIRPNWQSIPRNCVAPFEVVEQRTTPEAVSPQTAQTDPWTYAQDFASLAGAIFAGVRARFGQRFVHVE